MEFQEHHVEAELGMPAAAASYEEFGMPPNNGQEEPVVAAVPVPPPANTMARNSGKGKYQECLKNHAVGIGGHALDGCAEFLPAGEEGTLDALKCAACNCHRNFHRKETPDGTYLLPFHHRHQPPPPPFAPYYRAPAGYLHMTGPQHATLALPSTSGGGGTQSPREDQGDLSDPPTSGATTHGGSSSKKRFRTKFTQQQKDKMLAFAEKLGWRIQKHDEGVVQEFCSETGVQRHVLKVWMHNNKHTLGKKP
ncbi:Zinc-finger homeodomain protein 1 [Glycine soja]